LPRTRGAPRPRAVDVHLADVHPPQITELRVRYAETDQMGVVYHANYLAWCEVGRTEYIRSAGMSYRDIEEAGVGLAVSEATMRFHGAARYDDRVRVETRLTEVRSRSVTFEYAVLLAETGTRLVSATTRLVSVDRTGRTIAMPSEVRRFLETAAGLYAARRAAAEGA
jgi:acyl-CoA thioester hydrolase